LRESDVSVEAQIKDYIAKNLLFDEHAEIDGAASLLAMGTIDSTGVMDLVMFLEDEFGIEVDDEDLVPDNLDSVQKLARFVERKRARVKA
jgi:acyl carrier protein